MDRTQPLSPAWYLLALAIVIAGWVVGVAVAGGAWNSVRGASITSANEPLQAKGESVAIFTDVIQADRRIRCVAKASGKPAHVVAPAPIALTVEDDGATWHLIAFEPEGQDDMSVTCAPKDRRVDNSQYAFATVDGFVQRAEVGNWIMLSGMVGSAVAAGVVFFRRRQFANR